MPKDSSHDKLALARHAIGKDLLFFGIPAFLIFFFGLLISDTDGKLDSLVGTLWRLIRQPQNFALLSRNAIVGLSMFVVGMTIAFWSVGTLKLNYASSLVIRKSHQLITHGPYRFVRHPIYFGALVALLGVPVFAGSFRGFLTMALLVPMVLIRIKLEEHLLLEAFGETYITYQKTTRKLIPFIY